MTTQSELAALSEAAANPCGDMLDRMRAREAFRSALVNGYRTGKLVLIGEDAVERMARAIQSADVDDPWIKECPADIGDASMHLATAALAALNGEG